MPFVAIKVFKVIVKMKSAVFKQAYSGLKDLVLAVFAHNWNKLIDSRVTGSFFTHMSLLGYYICKFKSNLLEIYFTFFYYF